MDILAIINSLIDILLSLIPTGVGALLGGTFMFYRARKSGETTDALSKSTVALNNAYNTLTQVTSD